MATSILMPALSPTMTEGTLAKWHVKTGDRVQSGDLIAEIETDKATMEVEAIDDGIIGRILVAEKTENVAVNTAIAILLAEGEDPSATPDVKASGPEAAKQADKPAAEAPEKPAASRAEATAPRVKASPLARRIAKAGQIDLSAVKGTGPNGRIVKRDVESHTGNAQAATPQGEHPIAPGRQGVFERKPSTPIPHSGMRKVIAQRLTESKQSVPHFYVSMDVELDALLKLRTELNAVMPDEEGATVKISVNDMVIKAAALALRKVPGVNVSFTENEMIQHHVVDISVAVSVPGGLITPILRDADRLSLREISIEMKQLAQKARGAKLQPEEYQGGTFSISNMGMRGVKEFAAIINPPQSAILAVSAGEKRAVVRDDALAIATVMTVTLSVDHRAVDGILGAEWLEAFRHIVQNPYLLVV
ncbi:pyruvate dehydrogenase complex dihydrolipoamide acetyltransferase [Candidatus Kirkpatrickella diaphorinae]|uniref:Acetyltransferase component of pyruvate dehydrogenase complex n=1 Tax=Candidatus Kirkpatrickella diaphorinae TaxID=2984322 RepID=A0ABY6GM22_9PROT|nr:pyruvate dehydrogenase complex dihydrolipoamide acetyltransferase [Candidatus Kirkpatrickella diaphorinae]UYH51883.1 pyruvate dehydrogenase complex dihydrolipoamide acetyltransferase [Candidatus Kirkpatrickella diaphorinae]